MKKRIDEFSTGTLNGEVFDLRDWNGIPDFEGVSIPNIASLMLMIEEGGKRLLLTGDGQQKFIVDGLENTGFLAAKSGIHLDVLKVQHHGSENNVDSEFCHRVSADHYVFCGNGSSGNPETEVIDLVFNSRLGTAGQLTLAPQAKNRKFTFWFSTTSNTTRSGSDEHKAFVKLEAHVEKLRKRAKGKLIVRYNKRLLHDTQHLTQSYASYDGRLILCPVFGPSRSQFPVTR